MSVIYDPAHPDEARIDNFTERWLGSLILLIAGLVFTTLGSMLLRRQATIPRAT